MSWALSAAQVILLLEGALFLANSPPPLVPVTVSLKTEGVPAEQLSGLRVELRAEPLPPVAGDGVSAATNSIPGTFQLQLPAGARYLLRAAAPGLWAPEISVDSRKPPLTTELRLYRVGMLTGRFRPPAGFTLPPTLELSLEKSPGADQPAKLERTTVACPVSDGLFRCEVPVGRLDFRLSLPGAAAHFGWDVEVGPTKPSELGEIALRPGSSVTGWVINAAGQGLAGSQVRLLPQGAEASVEPSDRQQMRLRSFSADTNERGFFQIAGVPEGNYRLEAEAKGLAEARRDDVEVEEGLETRLRSEIVLDHPASLTLTVEPAVDPYGRDWRVDLGTDPPSRASLKQLTPGERGEAEATGLSPGPYLLNLRDQDGAVWMRESIVLEPGPNRQLLAVPLLEVDGVVRQGKRPLAARLFFHLPSGNAARVRFGADVEGKFSGFLPEAGQWRVQVEIPGEEGRVTLGIFEVRPAPGLSIAKLELQVPDTLVSGRVVNERGEAVAGAEVRAFAPPPREGEHSTRSDEKGGFRFRGLPEGSYTLSAHLEEASSDGIPVSLDEELDAPEATLVLRDQVEVRGFVLSRAGGVPGARLLVIPELGGMSSAQFEETHSSAGGLFRAKVPAGTSALTLVVAAPGFGVRMLRELLPLPGASLQVNVERGGGNLAVSTSLFRPNPDGTRRPMPILFHDGAAVPLAILMRFSEPTQRTGGLPSMVLPSLESGVYALCSGKATTQAWRQGSSPPPDECTSGFLAVGGELTLP